MTLTLALDEIRFLITNRTYLGREFLTWIWYVTEESPDHLLSLEGVPQVNMYLDDKITLGSTAGAAHESILKGGTPAFASESRSALLTGKLLQEAKFVIRHGEQDWTFSLKAEDLSIQTLKIPPIQESEPKAYMLKRLEYVEFVVKIIDSLYCIFMNKRLLDSFEEERLRMCQWILRKSSFGEQNF